MLDSLSKEKLSFLKESILSYLSLSPSKCNSISYYLVFMVLRMIMKKKVIVKKKARLWKTKDEKILLILRHPNWIFKVLEEICSLCLFLSIPKFLPNHSHHHHHHRFHAFFLLFFFILFLSFLYFNSSLFFKIIIMIFTLKKPL